MTITIRPDIAWADARLTLAHRLDYVIEFGYETPLRVWSGEDDANIIGLTGVFLASSSLAAIPPQKAGFARDQIVMGFNLATQSPTVISALAQPIGVVPVRVWCLLSEINAEARGRRPGHIASPYNAATAAWELFHGGLDQVVFRQNLSEVKETEIIVTVEHLLFGDGGITHRGGKFNDATQRARDPTDTSARFLSSIQRQAVIGKWGPPPQAPRTSRSNSLFNVIFAAFVAFITTGGSLAWAGIAAASAYVQQQEVKRQQEAIAERLGRVDTRIEVLSADTDADRRFVFGRCLIGGDVLYREVRNREWLQQTIMLSDHPIEELQEVWIGNGRYTISANRNLVKTDDENNPDENYGSLVRAVTRLDGTSTLDVNATRTISVTRYRTVTREFGGTVADSVTVEEQVFDGFEEVTQRAFQSSGWNPAQDKVTGCAIIFVEIRYSQGNVVPYHDMRFLVRGYNQVYDPRTRTTGYSDNVALVTAAWLNFVRGFAYSDGHLGAVTANDTERTIGTIDTTALTEAANVCDANNWRMAGAVQLLDNFQQILQAFSESMAGHVFFDGTRYIIRAGGWRAPVATITDAMLADFNGQWHRRRSDLFNAIGGVIKNDPDSEGGRFEEHPYPEFSSSTALAQDDNHPHRQEVDFPFVPSRRQALQLASILLNRNRLGKSEIINLPGLLGNELRPGDRITINQESPIEIDGTFLITGVTRMLEENITELRIIEDTEQVYTYSNTTISGLLAAVSNYVPLDDGSEGFTLDAPDSVTGSFDPIAGGVQVDGTAAIAVTAVIRSSIEADPAVSVDVELQLVGTVFQSMGNADLYNTNPEETRLAIGPQISSTTITLRARHRHTFGFLSDWTTGTYLVPADETPPQNAATVDVIRQSGTTVDLQVSAITARDLAQFEVRYTLAQLGANPATINTEEEWRAAPLLERLGVTPVLVDEVWVSTFNLPLTGVYRIYVRAIDRTGNMSAVDSLPSALVSFVNTDGVWDNWAYSSTAGFPASGVTVTEIGSLGAVLARSLISAPNNITGFDSNFAGGLLFLDTATDQLIQTNPDTGAEIRRFGQVLAPNGTPLNQINAMAVGSQRLYFGEIITDALYRFSGGSFGASPRINTDLVGPFNTRAVHGMTFHPLNGVNTLFMVDAQGRQDGLYTVNTTTGNATLVGRLDIPFPSAIASHEVDGAATLFVMDAVDNGLYVVDPETAAVTLIATIDEILVAGGMTSHNGRLLLTSVEAQTGSALYELDVGDLSNRIGFIRGGSLRTLLPETGRTGEESDAFANQLATISVWNSEVGWLMNPTRESSSYTSPPREFGQRYDASLRINVTLFNPRVPNIDTEARIQRSIRTRTDGVWTGFRDVDAATEIDADAVQVRLEVTHDPAGQTPRHSFGIQAIQCVLSAQTATTPPAETVISNAARGAVIVFAQPFISLPLVTANVISVIDNQGTAEPDDYRVTGEASATRTGVTLHIVRRSDNVQVEGRIRWAASGIVG